jgi:hypothetical protein
VLLRTASPVLLCLVMLTACGDDGLSRAEFVSRAEALCGTANTALDDEPEPTTPQEIQPYFESLLATARETAEDLTALAADQPDAGAIDTIFLTPLRGQVAVLEEYLPKVQAAVEGGEQNLSALEEPDLPEADLDAMRDYGFDDCVQTAEN